MPRTTPKPEPTVCRELTPARQRCWVCGGPFWIAYDNERVVITLDGVVHLTLRVRRCWNPECPRYHEPYRPEEEGALVLPHGEFGLDVIALAGALRYTQHRSVPEIHQELRRRGVVVCQRTVTNLLYRYEELLKLHLSGPACVSERLLQQGRVVLGLDGLQPDVGHEVVWVVRECLSGQVLLARSLLSGTEADLAELLREVVRNLPVPVVGAVSDGQHSIRNAVASALPDVAHQLCQYHYLKEAALPIYEADRHAKKELKKRVRGVRPIEREVQGRSDADAQLVQGYCHAVRSAITDDGRPPLCASGLKLHERLQSIHASIQRVTDRLQQAPSSEALPLPSSPPSSPPVQHTQRTQRTVRQSAAERPAARRRPPKGGLASC